MAVTRIKNNQITDATVVANAKLVDYSISSAKLANNLVYASDFTVSGNLTVNGNTTTIDTTITTIEDPVIVLASTQTSGSPVVDIGYLGYRGNQSNIAFVWDESATEFVTAFTSSGETNTTISITSYANFHTNDANIAGNLTIGGNIDITGNITSLNVTGNISGGNLLTSGLISATGNVTGGNVDTAGTVSATGNVTGGNVTTAGLISATGEITSAANISGGNVTTAGLISATGNVTGGNVNTAGDVSATGNITGNYFIGNGSQLTGVVASSVDANALTGNTLSSNVLFSSLTAVGTLTSLSVSGNTVTGNLETAGLVSATGNITGGNVDTAGLVTATGNITGGNVTTAGLISATGNVTGGNVDTAGTVSASGNVTGGNFLTSGLISATSTITSDANISGGNVLTGGIVSSTGNITGGNIDTAGTVSATGNITGGNLLTGGLISAAGLATSGNVETAGYVSATGNVTGGNIVSNVLTNTSGSLSISAAADLVLEPIGNIVLDGGKYINQLLDPVQAQDAATKQYVDDAVSSGIHIHTPVYLEANSAVNGTYAQGGNTATVNQTIAGNTVVFTTAVNLQPNDQLWFANGFEGIVANTSYFVVSAPNTSAAVLSTSYGGTPVTTITSNTGLTESVRINSGVGATLTNAGANATLVIDGVSTTNGIRVLIYSEANAVHNGVYDVTEAGNASVAWVLTRSNDADMYIPDTSTGLDEGSYFYVQSGSSGAGESYVQTAPSGPFIIGYDNLTFTQFSASQVYTANTNAGLSLTGTVFSAKVDNNTTAFDLGGNISVKAGANLTTPNIGDATGTTLSLTGNVTGGNVLTGGYVSATGNVTGGNVDTAGIVTATGNITGGNVTTAGLISATGNVTGGNVDTAGLVTATGNVTGGNLLTAGIVSATGTGTFGNVDTAGTVSATGNVTGGNVDTAGTVSATGNITGGNILSSGSGSFTGNVTAANFIGNISGNIDAAGANTQVQFNDTGDILGASAAFTFDKAANLLTVTGNIQGDNLLSTGIISATGTATVGNLDTAGTVSATGNITGGNVDTAGLVTATGNITGGNVNTAGLVTATGNITGGNVDTSGLVTATGNVTGGNLLTGGEVSALGNVTGNNVVGTTSGQFGNIVISGDDITDTNGRVNINVAGADVDFAVNGDTVANVFYVDAGTGTASFGSSTQTVNAIVAFNSTNSILAPVGNTGQRPATGVTGMLRFNTTDNNLELFDNTEWTAVGVPSFTVIADEQFSGDGSTVAFTLATDQTTNSCIVSINGVVQIPVTAYSVSGTTLTFTEAPLSGDLIDVREITTTTTVTAISNTSGNAVVEVSDASNNVTITGGLIPAGNLTQTLGTATNRWSNLYVGGNTIHLGNLQLKEASANTFAVYTSDGVTEANIAIGDINVTNIQSDTITVGNIVNSNANGIGNIGSSTTYFNTVFAKATSAQYADLAEKYVADAEYAPGTVVVFGGTHEVTVNAVDGDRRVAGVVSTNPSYIMNGGLEADYVATVALTGRVPCMVVGPVLKGDMMIAAGLGRARAEADPKVGTVIGKALEDFNGTEGTIEVVVGRF